MKHCPVRLPILAVVFLTLAACPLRGQQPSRSLPILPDPKLTPGDTLDVTLTDIQEKGYSAKVRNVPVKIKREVYAAYGIEHWIKGEYEIDHLISLSLGGSNSKKNLWPQSYQTQPWNAHVKDQLEDKLLALVRAGKVDLHTAQREMAANWIEAYKKYVSPTPRKAKKSAASYEPDTDASAPDVSPSGSPAAAPVNANAEPVWVNTESGVIWKPGSKFYGKTKKGRYMKEADALAAGYHQAK